jgi:hypothetical protein
MQQAGKSLALWTFGLVAGVSLTVGLGRAPSLTAGDPPARAGETIAFTTPSSSGGHLLYVIDGREKVLSVYEVDGKKSKLKLTAARHFQADHQLAEFNNEAPAVADIEALVRRR